MSKKKFHREDPFRARESKKYENPIPSREYILQCLEKYERPISFPKLLSQLEVEDEADVQALEFRLRAMQRDGQLMRDRRGRYCLIEKLELIKGTVIGHPDGYGFVEPDKGGSDLFLSAAEMRQVFPGDRVLVREMQTGRRGRREGVIQEVIARNTEEMVGRFYHEQGIGYVDPENKRVAKVIQIPPGQEGAAEVGQIVMVSITGQPDRRTPPIGRITEVLGEHMAPGMEIDVAIRAHEIPYRWSEEVEAAVKQFSPEVSEADKKGRTDLREMPFVTIDGEDARDFDDAVHAVKKPRGGWILYVAIADVSHYVTMESALDVAAKERGNSVYFPQRVVPMLPEILSNTLCSLNPKVDRLAMVCEVSLNPKGKVMHYRFFDAVIQSKARMTYTDVAKILVDKDSALQEKYAEQHPHLSELYSLYHILKTAREQRGAIDFDTIETQIIFDADKKIDKIVPTQRNDAHRLIEECMLLANVCAAEHLKQMGFPVLYRVHAPPHEEKMTLLREFLAEFGLSLRGGSVPKPKDFQEVLNKIKGKPEAQLIQTVLLRSLTQAVYTTENAGHFGLAYPAYAHFTSPIRRYPDLLVHRALRAGFSHQTPEEYGYSEVDMENIGVHCSMTERRADEATRDAIDWLKCEYMQDRLGKTYEGRISGVTDFGLFVVLKEVYVEGLVHITALRNDYYHFDAKGHRLVGQRTGSAYRLGDSIRVLVARVNLDDKKIDFTLAL